MQWWQWQWWVLLRAKPRMLPASVAGAGEAAAVREVLRLALAGVAR